MDRDPYDHGFEKTVSGVINTLERAAEKGATHIAFQDTTNKPVYLSLPDTLKDIAASLRAADAQGRVDDVKTLMATGIRALYFNSKHIIALAEHHNDPNILEAGYPFKPRPGAKAKVSLLDLVPDLMAKYLTVNRVIVPGAYAISIKRVKPNEMVELQVTETPNDEASWRKLGEGMYNEARVEFRGQEEMKKLFVRGRYHEKGETGQWSKPVSIIIH